MQFVKAIPFFTFLIIILSDCSSRHSAIPPLSNKDIKAVIEKITEIMVHDVTNPPLAARFFAYTCLSGYEIISQNNTSYRSMSGRLNNFPMTEEASSKEYNHQVSAILAMIKTAQELLPTGSQLEEFEKVFLNACRKKGYTEEVIRKSQTYASEVSTIILAYAKSDGYRKISNYPRYTPLPGESNWYPTPPGYITAVEPYFNTIRTFTLDSSQQFKPPKPVAFSTAKDSEFQKMLEEVYEVGNKLSEEEKAIASFWDCNPFALQRKGHLMVGLKKISPGAHWMGIAGIACDLVNKDFNKSMEIHTMVAIGLMDAFISCWDEKYRSNRIRPETAIRKYIDPTWEPLLQTPPFPEYTSGHSTISATAAYILTYFFNDQFEFTDTVEVPYGLPPKHFSSFMEAAEEAAISRLYGGIHYRDANEKGTVQGLSIGKHVIKCITESNDI